MAKLQIVKRVRGVLLLSASCFGAALSLSCSEVSAGVEAGGGEAVFPIEFAVIDIEADVKGKELTSDNISDFGVFAALEVNEQSGIDGVHVDELQLFMDDVPVNKTALGWCSDPEFYWPLLSDKQLSFFAYAPHSSGQGIEARAQWGAGVEENRSKSVAIRYTMSPDPAEHEDLCIAQAVVDRVMDQDLDGVPDPVRFNFQHALASVTFAANYVGTVPAGCYLRIDELTMRNFVDVNTLIYNYEADDYFAWEEIPDDAPRNGSLMLNIGRSTLSSQVRIEEQVEGDKKKYKEFMTMNGIIYMLPQKINPMGTDVSGRTAIDVTFSYVKDDVSNAVVAQFYTSTVLPVETEDDKIVLEMARRYKFLFTLDVSKASLVNVSCVDAGKWLVDWENSGNVHNDTLIK